MVGSNRFHISVSVTLKKEGKFVNQVPKYTIILDLGMNKIGYLLKYIPSEINSIAEAEITC